MPTRANVIKARVAKRPASGGTTAPNKGPVHQGIPVKNAPRSAIGTGQKARKFGGLADGVGNKPVGGMMAGAPGAPPPAPTMPWDSNFQLAAGAAEKGYGDKFAYLNSKRLMTQQAYGIDPQFSDPKTNPFSRAALLKKSFTDATRGTTNSYAAQGQLYAGSVHNAQGANRNSYDRGYDELNRSYLADLGEIDRETAEAVAQREAEINEARWRQLEVAQGEAPEPQAAPAGGGGNKVKQKAKAKVHKARKAR